MKIMECIPGNAKDAPRDHDMDPQGSGSATIDPHHQAVLIGYGQEARKANIKVVGLCTLLKKREQE